MLVVSYNDKPYVLNDRCPHMRASLYKGTLDQDHIICAAHGAKINVTNGEIAQKAKLLFVKIPTKRARTYETKVEADAVLVNL